MAWLFIVGSACFAIGPVLTVMDASATLASVVFFVGSLFFTSASTIQLLLARETLAPGGFFHRLFQWRNGAWSSAAIQWLGTLAFNVTTFRSVVDALGTRDLTANAVWNPDAVGSVLFLVSSAIACMPEVRRHRHGHVRDRSWLIAALNMLGSLFFGLSAIGAYTIPKTGELVNEVWSNGGTFLGALGFLVGAWLLLPRRSSEHPR
jgi:hypothetical protein